MNNKQRADRAMVALTAFKGSDKLTNEEAFRDLLSDMRHLGERLGLDTEAEFEYTARVYAEERAEDADVDPSSYDFAADAKTIATLYKSKAVLVPLKLAKRLVPLIIEGNNAAIEGATVGEIESDSDAEMEFEKLIEDVEKK